MCSYYSLVINRYIYFVFQNCALTAYLVCFIHHHNFINFYDVYFNYQVNYSLVEEYHVFTYDDEKRDYDFYQGFYVSGDVCQNPHKKSFLHHSAS